MTIIHKVDEFLGELFPRYKAAGFDEAVLKEELIQYYTFSVYRPTIEIKDGFVTVNIDAQRIAGILFNVDFMLGTTCHMKSYLLWPVI